MASGTINGSTNNQYIKCKITWTSTKNVSANTSSVTAKLYYWRTNTGYRTYGAEKYTLTINGVSKSVERSYSDGIELTNSTPVLAHTFTTTVSHNADGKKSITIKATGGKTSGSFTSTSCSGTATLTLTVSDDTVPIASMTVSEAVESVHTQIGAYVKGQSKLTIVLSGEGSYGSTIKSYKITANGKTYTSATATTDYLTTAGTNAITGTVTDSRGRTKSVSKAITALDYAAPSVTGLSAVRCDEDGTANEEGSFAKVTFSWKISDCNNKNTKSASVTYKKRSNTSWQSAPAVTLSGYTGTESVILSGINTENIYDVLVTVRDYFYSGSSGVSRGTYVPTAFTLVDYRVGGHGIAFGKVAEEDVFDVNLKSRFRKGVYLMDNTNTEYAGMYDNGTNLWIGANQGDNGVHHIGSTYISSGINSSTQAGNKTIGVYVPDGAGDGVFCDVWHKGMTFKSLWSGTWNSGTITVPGIQDYSQFRIGMDGQGTVITAYRWGSHLRGIGGYVSSAGNKLAYLFTATLSGDALTWVNCVDIYINTPSTVDPLKVTTIYGIM